MDQNLRHWEGTQEEKGDYTSGHTQRSEYAELKIRHPVLVSTMEETQAPLAGRASGT